MYAKDRDRCSSDSYHASSDSTPHSTNEKRSTLDSHASISRKRSRTDHIDEHAFSNKLRWIDPLDIKNLLLDPKRDRSWRFTKRMKREFVNKLSGRIWLVNTQTKIWTNMNDVCSDTSSVTPPPGLHVFHPVAPPDALAKVVEVFRRLSEEEIKTPTFPSFNPVRV